MTIDHSGNNHPASPAPRTLAKRLRDRRAGSARGKTKRARLERRLQTQSLETRQLLAGPELIGIQPNVGDLITGGNSKTEQAPAQSKVLDASPRELVFHFDNISDIDIDSLGTTDNPLGIALTRRGDDGVFEVANATYDFETGGTTQVEFRAGPGLPGTRGNGVQIELTTSFRPISGARVDVQVDERNRVVRLDLNQNPNSAATVRDVLDAITGNAQASRIVTAFRISGASSAPVGTSLANAGGQKTVTLIGANAAETFTDFGLGANTRVRVVANEWGAGGRDIRVNISQRALGTGGVPLVNVAGNTISVEVDSGQTTVDQFITAIQNSSANSLITITRQYGDSTAQIPFNFIGSLALQGANDEVVTPGFVGLGDSPNEVVFRFAEPLPDDFYQVDIFGVNPEAALRNVNEEAFNDEQDFSVRFGINVAPQVLAVVPEPVIRNANGTLSPQPNVIEVYFTSDVRQDTILNPNFYQLIYTRDSVNHNTDRIGSEVVDVQTGEQINQLLTVVPIPGRSDAVQLTYQRPFSRTPDPDTGDPNDFIDGAIRLKIGNDSSLPNEPVTSTFEFRDTGDSFATAEPILGFSKVDPGETVTVRLTDAAIDNAPLGAISDLLNFPGGPDYPGVRDVRPDDPTRLDRTVPLSIWRNEDGDQQAGITTAYYNFPSNWIDGAGDNAGQSFFNLITDEQRQRVREVLSLFSQYLGIQFVEVGDTAADGTSRQNVLTGLPAGAPLLSIAVGDLVGIEAVSGPGSPTVAARALDADGRTIPDGFLTVARDNDFQLLVMDVRDFDASVDDQTGGEFFRGAMLGVGQLLGYGYGDHLPQPVTQSNGSVLDPFVPEAPNGPTLASEIPTTNEPAYPSPSDVVNGQFLFQPESNDIDMYAIEIEDAGTLTVSTIAERLTQASTLDTSLRLFFQPEGALPTETVEIAANDDYFSNDSLIELEITQPGTYYIGVSASGNQSYDPIIEGTGVGGVTEGTYDLVMKFEKAAAAGILDKPVSDGITFGASNLLDGDADGKAGGDYNFWFQPTDSNTTIYVDSESGTNLVDRALNAQILAQFPGDLGQVSVPLAEVDDAIRLQAYRASLGIPVEHIRIVGGGVYEFGSQIFGNDFKDGVDLLVPKNTNLIIDAGSTFRMQGSHITVGSTSQTQDRSNASIQVLGIPGNTEDGNPNNDRDGMVQFVGTTNVRGAWGGINLRGDIDYRDDSRVNREDAAVFLNHIQFADIQNAGGQVRVDGVNTVVSAIELNDVRATIVNNTITNSADAAISASPDTFMETRFDESRFQDEFEPGANAPTFFSSDVMRVGPHVRGNTIVDNTFNGIQIHVDTPTGGETQTLNVNARLDDTDIVHILTENLLIEGSPGGTNSAQISPSVVEVIGTPRSDTNIGDPDEIAQGTYVYRITFVDDNGYESAPSNPTNPVTFTDPFSAIATGSIQLTGLPTIPSGTDFTGRRLYRAQLDALGVPGEFRRVARLNATDGSFRDTVRVGGNILDADLVTANLLASANNLVSANVINNATGLVEAGQYVYRFTFVNSAGREVGPSSISNPVTVIETQGNAINVTGLPAAPAGSDIVSRILYRTQINSLGGLGDFRQVGLLDASSTSFIDNASVGSDLLVTSLTVAPKLARAARLDPGLKLDPGTIVKLDGARIDVTFGAHLYAEGDAQNPVVLTSLNDDRYGTGGTFDTNSLRDISGGTAESVLRPGDWSGIVASFGSDASFDNAVLSGGGGVSRIEGAFASFNVIEVHQSDVRITNSLFDLNADGRGFLNDNANSVNNPDDPREQRVGRINNASGTIFVRASQPIITGNRFFNGSGPAMSFDINSFGWQEVIDHGRSTGPIEAMEVSGNSGPLITENLIGVTGDNGTCSIDAFAQNPITDADGNVIRCGLNGLEVRGGKVATEVVLDDTDIVHIVRDMIEIPNQHIYGGLRLESDARSSLVLKFENQDLDNPDPLLRRQAGIVAGGTLISAEDELIDIRDRIGGSLQIVGQPDFPVILTSLADDTVGAGFTPDGFANIDTNNDGVLRDANGDPIFIPLVNPESFGTRTPPLLPLGQEFDRTDRVEIDNGPNLVDDDIEPGTLGYFEATVLPGGEIQQVDTTGINTANNTLVNAAYQMLYTTFINIDPDDIPLIVDPPPVRLSATAAANTIVTKISPDLVRTTGTYDIDAELAAAGIISVVDFNRSINWTVDTFFVNNRAVAYSKVELTTADGRAFDFGNIEHVDVVSYFDQTVPAPDNDVLYRIGTPGESDFRLMTLNNTNRIGFSHGAVYDNDSVNQVNANYSGWTTDFRGPNTSLENLINIDVYNTSIEGVIPNTFQNAPIGVAPLFDGVTDGTFALQTVQGNPSNIETAHEWRLFDSASSSLLTTFIEFIASDPNNPEIPNLPSPIQGAGAWDGVTIREAASDFNVAITGENEPENVRTVTNDTNALPSRAQYLGELASTSEASTEHRRGGLIVDGSLSSPGDVDVYSFIAEAGTEVWLDIDRTNSRVDTVIELIDSNGRTIVLSDDSNVEAQTIEELRSLDPGAANFASEKARLEALLESRIGDSDIPYEIDQLFGLSSSLIDPTGGPGAFQDDYSTNKLDPGMRLVLPGVTGRRSAYTVRVRSALNTANKDVLLNGKNRLVDASTLRRGLTSGSYQLQIRLGEEDVFPGTQIRYSDVRFAVNGVQIVGGPMHSPLTGTDYERETVTILNPDGTVAGTFSNDTLQGAQRLGIYDTQYVNADNSLAADFTNQNPNPTAGGLTDASPATQLNDGRILINRDNFDQQGNVAFNGVDIDLENPASPLGSDQLSKNISGFLDDVNDVDWYQFDVDYRQIGRDDAALYLATVFDLDYADGLARTDTMLHVFNASGQLVLVGGDSNVADDQPISAVGFDPTDLSRGSFGTNDPYIGSAELPEGTYYVAVSNQGVVPAVLDQFTTVVPTNPLLRLEPIDSVRRIAEEGFDGGDYGGTAAAPVVPVLFDDSSIIEHSLDDVYLYVNTSGSLSVVNPFTGFVYTNIGSFGDEVRDIAFTANGELFGYTGFNDRGTGDDNWSYNRIDTASAGLTQLSVGAQLDTFHDRDIETVIVGQQLVQILDEPSNDGMEVEAITIRARFGQETGYFVANRPQGQQGLDYISNILYSFDEETGIATGPVSDLRLSVGGGVSIAGAGATRREIGQINTDTPTGALPNQLGITAATAPISGFGLSTQLVQDPATLATVEQYTLIVNSPAQVPSGQRLQVNGPNGRTLEFRDVADQTQTGAGNVRVTLDRSLSSEAFAQDLDQILRGLGIQTTISNGVQIQFPVSSAFPTTVNIFTPSTLSGTDSSGVLLPSLYDGDNFTLSNGNEQFTFEFDQGFTLITTSPASIPNGQTLEITLPGQAPVTYEFSSNQATVSPGNTWIPLDRSATSSTFIRQLETQLANAGIPVSAAGNQLSFPTATTVTVEAADNTVIRGFSVSGAPGVVLGNFPIALFPTDTPETIALRIQEAVTEASFTASPPLTAIPQGNSLAITGVITDVSSRAGSLVAGGFANGGSITGIELVGGQLFAVSDQGGLYRVTSGLLNTNVPANSGAIPPHNVGQYIPTATDLRGINFTGLRAGPSNVEGGRFSNLLFGTTSSGEIYAFNTDGELQPIFAGGRTSISTGINGLLGLDFSTLDKNLWHIGGAGGAGHGLNDAFHGARPGQAAGNALQFNFGGNVTAGYPAGENPVQAASPRQDGQDVAATYNFPGGAHGSVESNSFSLEGYSSGDQPTLYFTYFLETDGFDPATDPARTNTTGGGSENLDTLRVYVIDNNGVEHLVATNNENRAGIDEFDDPAESGIYDDDIDVNVQQLYDNTNTWRQARVPLGEFAGQPNLALRVEFATAGTTATGTGEIRTVAASNLIDGDTFEIGGETFVIDLAPSITFPSGPQLAKFYLENPTEAATFTVDGQAYLLNDGTRTVPVDTISIDVRVSDQGLRPLSELSAGDVAQAVRDFFDVSIDLTRLVPSGTDLALFYQGDRDNLFTIFYEGNTYVLSDGGVDENAIDPALIVINVLDVYQSLPDTDLDKRRLVDLTQEDVALVFGQVIGETDGAVEYDQLVPDGADLSVLYSDNAAVFVITIDGVDYVLNDGNRVVQPGQISVNLGDVSQADIAEELQLAVEAQNGVVRPTFSPTNNFDFSDPSDDLVSQGTNDLIYEATPLPYVAGSNKTISGNGKLGLGPASAPTRLTDVDLVSLDVIAGTTIAVDTSAFDPVGAPVAVDLNVRFFDSTGAELRAANGSVLAVRNPTRGTVTLDVPNDGTIYIGISGPGNDQYDPRIEGSANPAQRLDYTASIRINPVAQISNTNSVVEFEGAGLLTVNVASGLVANNQGNFTGIPLRLSRFDNEFQVAAALRQVLANTFTSGNTALIPLVGSAVRLPNLSLDDSGPFLSTAERYGDGFAGGFGGGAADNDSAGAFIDDVLIGFAERGELVTASNSIAPNDTFTVLTGEQTFGTPGENPSGAYQLEIRDASEYVASGQVSDRVPEVNRDVNGDAILVDSTGAPFDPATSTGNPFGVNAITGGLVNLDLNNEPVSLFDITSGEQNALFRAFDTNDRLTGASVTLTALDASAIQDGATFTLADGNSRLTFEFDVLDNLGNSNGAIVANNRIKITIPHNATAGEVADRVLASINSPVVRSVLDVTAARSNGTAPSANNPTLNQLNRDARINLYGGISIRFSENPTAFETVVVGDRRGDTNRDKSEQGVIIVENSRVLFSSNAGIDITRDGSAGIVSADANDFTPSVLTYARNFGELNTESLIPGVVVQNNVVGYNANFGIRTQGLYDEGFADQLPVGFDRILNNTLIGGVVEAGVELGSQFFGSLLFDQGGISFADAVREVTLGTDASSEFTDLDAILSSPDCHGIGPEPGTGQFTLSLGSGGSIVLEFRDNLLVGDGTGNPDLVIFETGTPERVGVEISRDGVTFISVGTVFGLENTIDLDRFGFGPNDQFSFVRLTDLTPAGSFEFGPAGADIDAVGAISTIPREIYTPGAQGIEVRQNSAPTLLNNIVSNFQTGLSVIPDAFELLPDGSQRAVTDQSADLTVIGATTFFNNAFNARTTQIQSVGLYPQFIDESQQIFVDPANLIFTPQALTVTIDSSIESLEDRASLTTVRGSLGLPPRPIIAPTIDLNGQFRIDNGFVETPSGQGGNAFIDRGAEERRDNQGPRFVPLTPRGEDLTGILGRTTATFGSPFDPFEIQLVDGILPADNGTGVGINDGTVLSDVVRVSRLLPNAAGFVTLEEGVDYQFAYEPADNVIRLSPIAGIWDDQALYTIELIGSFLDQSSTGLTGIFRGQVGSGIPDGAITQIGNGVQLSLNLERLIQRNVDNEVTLNLDGQTITVFDGFQSRTFEFDTNGSLVSPSVNLRVPVTSSSSADEILDALALAIDQSDIQLAVRRTFDRSADPNVVGQIQLAGLSRANDTGTVTVAANSILTATGDFSEKLIEADTGIQLSIVPDALRVAIPGTGTTISNLEGQTFTVFDGIQSITFEFDTEVVPNFNEENTPIRLPETASPEQISDLLARAINQSPLQLIAIHLRDPGTGTDPTGRLQLLGISDYNSLADVPADQTRQSVSATSKRSYVSIPDGSFLRHTNQILDVQLLVEITDGLAGQRLTNFDGNTVVVFDGEREYLFEFDTDNINALTLAPQTIPSFRNFVQVRVADDSTPRELVDALLRAMDDEGLNVEVSGASGTFRISGTSGPISVTSTTGAVLVTGNSDIGTSPGFGIQIPTQPAEEPAIGNEVSDFVQDGQTFTITRGTDLIVNFEIDLDGFTLVEGAVPVRPIVLASDVESVDALANGLVEAIRNNVPGLNPRNVGSGQVTLGGSDIYRMNLQATALSQIGLPGSDASSPVIIPIDDARDLTLDLLRTKFDNNLIYEIFTGDALQLEAGVDVERETGEQLVAELYRLAISDAGVAAERADRRVFLDGVSFARGGNIVQDRIEDEVGNRLLSGDLQIFVGQELDFGDASAPYKTRIEEDGARHQIDPNRPLYLGQTVSAEANGVADDSDLDDGVEVLGVLRPGFGTTFEITVNQVEGSFPATFQPAADTIYVDAWFDWDRDGVFEATAGEVIRLNSTGDLGTRTITEGTANLVVNVPNVAALGEVQARFRISHTANLGPDGIADAGEVEDHTFTVANNLFQNSSIRHDVNASGAVTPLDALLIINALNAANSDSISLVNPPASIPLPPFPDVNGDGRVSALDALLVINELNRIGGVSEPLPSGEPLASAVSNRVEGFTPVASGVLASAATIAFDPTSTSESSGPEGTLTRLSESNLSTETLDESPKLVGGQEASVFDSAAVIQLDSIVDSLAQDRETAQSDDSDPSISAIDEVFAGLN